MRGPRRRYRASDGSASPRTRGATAHAWADGASSGPGVPQRRLAALAVVWVVAFALLAVRMVDLQVVRAGPLGRLAVRQQLESLTLPGRRGLIVDSAGRPLAINVEVDSVYAVPKAIDDPGAFARAVAPVLGLTPAEVRVRLSRGGPYFAWLARRRPAEVADRLRALNLGDVVGIAAESRRAYPAGTLAANLLGFTGTDDDGLAGLELQYDRLLRGTGGVEVADRDAIGRELVQTQRIVTPPRDGATLVLTIDEVIQHIAERELARAVEQTHAHAGIAIVMDPETGALLALAAAPSFDPNRYQAAPPARWKSPAVADVYEPGSTFKLILAAAALDSHAVTLDDRWTDPGKIRINGVTIHDAEPTEHFESLGLADIIKYSSNVGAAQVATRLGKDTMYAYIRQFGFGRPTGVDLPGEAAGLVRPVAQWFGPTLQNIAFGQGISVTPIQLLVAASSFGTDGLAVRPHVVAVVRDASGRTIATPGDGTRRRVIDAGVAKQVLAMMREVVRAGTGVKAQLDGYAVAGKTGTAQRPGPSGGYEPGAYIASFVGLVPVPSPRLAILVVVDRPRGIYFGGDVAAPVFHEIARQALWYLRVPPEDSPEAAMTPPAGAAAASPKR
ncbi:MAG TPA: penicillin-binding transpeptidase domain-containing protein [bacterium]|nr:penicillin-binding transpeptidase domain-containing protein [bacterium]